MTARAHVFTVDVEDWYQGLALDPGEWPRFAPRLQTGLARLLGLLDEAGVRATFFVVGWQAERTPEVVRDMARHGHEIACHGYSHHFVYRQARGAFREEVRRSRGVLEDIVGAPVVGFRAPFFSITADALWALDVLVEEGFLYDSSIFPMRVRLYGVAGAPLGIYRPALADLARHDPAGPVVEFPVAVRALGPLRLPVAGGFYLRALPLGLLCAALEGIRRE
ncbi:MAG TPA: polysaccharide deacetylase family protein, partial [Methylomirabilota bacterium]|nr:polysaccharide deacetylase family protein [Methylomirabilota bacterium]